MIDNKNLAFDFYTKDIRNGENNDEWEKYNKSIKVNISDFS